jgi:hypothetical protein
VIEKTKSAAVAHGAISASAATQIDILRKMFIVVMLRFPRSSSRGRLLPACRRGRKHIRDISYRPLS